jgi:cobalt/nickel transport system permease protein
MHISEGVLAAPVLVGGAVLAAAGLAAGLKTLRPEQTVPSAMVAAVFFLASLAHVPLGPANAHLVLNGLVGLILGWGAFPAIFVALSLQAVLFQFGGLTTLGANTLIMAAPAVACALACRPLLRAPHPRLVSLGAFLTGFCALGLSGCIMAACLALSGEAFLPLAWLALLGHLPLMVVEGLISLAAVNFLHKVKPEVLAFVSPAGTRD